MKVLKIVESIAVQDENKKHVIFHKLENGDVIFIQSEFNYVSLINSIEEAKKYFNSTANTIIQGNLIVNQSNSILPVIP